MKISKVWANNNKNDDSEFIEKVNQEMIYIQNNFEENLYLLENGNWQEIESNIDSLYIYWNTVILDLNELEIKSTYLSDFGKKLDELTLAVNDKNKNVTKIRICELYNYVYLYIQNYSTDEEFNNKFNIKRNLILAYCIAENENWELIYKYIKNAEESVKNILNLNIIENRDNLNRLYISIKELENSIELKDLELFYKKHALIEKVYF